MELQFYLRNDTKRAKLRSEQIPKEKKKSEVIVRLERAGSGQDKSVEESDRDVF
jgi:hypothetical protein